MALLNDPVVRPNLFNDRGLRSATPEYQHLLDSERADAASQFGRGWESADLGGTAMSLKAKAAEAYAAGDTALGQSLEQQGKDMGLRAAAWAPTVRNMTDIGGVGDAMDWAGGALGNMRTSVAPFVGGVVGGAVGLGAGALAAPFTGGVVNPLTGATWGARLGSLLAGYGTEYDEALAGAMDDPTIRRTRTYDDMINAARVKGGINAGLEGLVPGALAKSLFTGAAEKAVKGQLLKRAAKEAGKNATTEAATEASQSLVGQGTQNALLNNDITDFDYKQALNEAAAGAVGGGGMSAAMSGVQAVKGVAGGAFDKTADVVTNPVRTITDGISAAGNVIGKGAAKAVGAVENYADAKAAEAAGMNKDEFLSRKTPGTESIWAEVDRMRGTNDPHAGLSDITHDERVMDDKTLDSSRHETLHKLAGDILASRGNEYPSEARAAAAELKAGKIQWPEFRERVKAALDDRKTKQATDDFHAAATGTKKSMMRPTLTDDFGEQEGRAMTDDTVTNDFGDQVGKQGLLRKDLDNKAPAAPFNYESGQRSAGIEAAKKADTSEQNNRSGVGNVTRKAVMAENRAAAEAVKDPKVHTLAKVLTNIGYDEKLVNAATSASKKEEDTYRMAGLVTWIKHGFQNKAETIPAMLKIYGDKSGKMLEKAYEAAVNEGVATRDDATHKAVQEEIGRIGLSGKQRFDAVMENMLPSIKQRATPESVAKILEHMQTIAKTGGGGENVTKGGNTKSRSTGERALTDNAVLKAIFGDGEIGRQHIANVMATLVEPKNQSPLSIGEDPDADKSSDVGVTETNRTDTLNGDAYFDKKSVEGRKALADATAKQTKAKSADDATARNASHVGIIDHAIEKAEAEKGAAIPQRSKDKITRDLVHAHNPDFGRLPAAPKHLSDLAKKDYDKRKAEYDKKLAAEAKKLNDRYVALRVTESEIEKQALEFSKADIEKLELNRDLRDPKNGLAAGTLLFEKADAKGKAMKTPFITSAPMIMARMFSQQEKQGFVHTDTNASAYTPIDLFLDGVSSVATADGFTGRVGWISNRGEVVWMSGSMDFPENLKLFGGNKTAPRFYGAEKQESKTVRESAKEIRDFDPDQEHGLVQINTDSPHAKLQELNGSAVLKVSDAERKKIKALTNAFYLALKLHKEKGGGEARIESLTERVDEMFNEHFPEGSQTKERAYVGNVKDGQAVDGMAAFDGGTVRTTDERGMTASKNVEMVASGLIGTKEGLGKERDLKDYGRDTLAAMSKGEEQARRDPVRKGVAVETTPTSGRAHLELTRVFDGVVTGLSAEAIEDINRVLKQMPALGELMGNVLHTAVAKNDEGLNGAYMLAQPLEKLGGHAIVLSERALADTKNNAALFKQNYAHEVGHSLEGAGVFDIAKDFARDSAVAAEAKSTSGDLKEHLRYAMGTSDATLKSIGTDFASELHAIVFGLYVSSTSDLKVQMPNTFATLEAAYGNEGQINKPISAPSVQQEQGKVDARGGSDAQGRSASEGEPSAPSGPSSKGKLLKNLKSAEPVSPRHRAAIKEAVAILEGKDGDLNAALEAVFRASEYFGKSTERSEIEEMNNALADVADDYLDYERSLQDNERDYEAEFAEASAAEETVADEPSGAAQELQGFVDQHAGKNKFWEGMARKALASGDEKQIAGALAAAKKQFGEAKQSEQKASSPEASEADQAAALKHILETIGSKIEVGFTKAFGDNSSGSWTPGQHQNTIELALNGDVLGTAFHESFHEFFDILRKNGGADVVAALERAAMNPLMQAKLNRLLNGHPEAQKQAASSPEEAAAFMYQFWRAGKLTVGPAAKTTFQKITDFLKSLVKQVAAAFSETVRADLHEEQRGNVENANTEQLLRAFTTGAVSNADTRAAVVGALNKDAVAQAAAVKAVGENWQKFANTAGQMMFSSEAMMDATGNKHLVEVARWFHQKAGTAMKGQGGYFDGLRTFTNQYMNKVSTILEKYEPEDIELARQAKSTGVAPTATKAKELVAEIDAFFKEMGEYIGKNDVRRFNPERRDESTGRMGVWEKIDLRQDYWPRVVDTDFLGDHVDDFKKDLIEHHKGQLQFMANDANNRLAKQQYGDVERGTALDNEIKRAMKEFNDSGKIIGTLKFQPVTVEQIAEAIALRFLNANGQIDIEEDSSELGITPMAAAVNRREMDWLDMTVFDKYMSKDAGAVIATYARNMVKRAEYQKRFGYNGEKIRNNTDKAVLMELGGDALVDKAMAGLDAAQKAWDKRAAAAHKAGEKFEEDFPSIRSVGLAMHRAAVAAKHKTPEEARDAYLAEHAAVLAKLGPAFKAIQAQEGTLGNDISPTLRAANGWITTYQSIRTLPFMLFTSMTDTMGIVVNGGELKDAWKAFTVGMREIKNSLMGKASDDLMMERGAMWGAVDAANLMDSIAQAQSSPFMSGKAKLISDKFFKAIGAEGWNRGIRAVAANVAERTILEWARGDINMQDKAAVARLERLYGEGAKVSDIKLDANGQLDIHDQRNISAVNRWVLDAVPSPNAAHRAIWMSDPHYQTFAHLKNYTYTQHRVLINGALAQAKLGNLTPTMTLALGYMPVAIAAGAIKEMLIPGDEPPWMKGGLGSYLSYGWARAGVLGVPQMYGEALWDADPARILGPTVDQIQNAISIPLPELKLSLPIVGNIGLDDHTILGESFGALPAGGVMKRIVK